MLLNALYKIRSSISHTGYSIMSELSGFGVGVFGPPQDLKEWKILFQLDGLIPRILRSWLKEQVE